MFTDLEFIKTCLNGLLSRIEEEIADLPHPDWNQNDDTQPDYVKNRPFYTGDPMETVYIKEHTVMFSDAGDGLYVGMLQSAFKATVGETYKISWDGTVYECVCVNFNGGLVIGNASILGAGSDTDEPFVIVVVNDEGILSITADTSASHTFSISKTVVPVVKIDEKYLPDTVLSFKPASKSYLTFSSPNSFTLAVNDTTKHWDGTLEYFASDRTWTAWDGITALSAVDNGGEYVLYLRGTGNTIITGNDRNYRWELTGTDIRCIGNIENLLDYTTVESGGHPTMAPYCYHAMFERCESLTQAPALPATTLAPSCYHSMFADCTSLTQAPALPATTLVENCYDAMFLRCESLTQAPALPATTLAPSCYHDMFDSCASLTQAPALPATTLAPYCYHSMFFSCTSLTQVPALPATTLAEKCYIFMFYYCTSLKLSTTQTGEYMQEYRIPSSGEGTTTSDDLGHMFESTGGTFTGTPDINETYYLSSDNMVVHDTEVATLREYVGSMIDFAIGEYGVSNIDRANWNAKASKPKACLVTLGSSDWDATAKTQVVAVSSVVADEPLQIIHPIPKIGQSADYNAAGIQLVGRGAGNVTFMCNTIPEKDIEVWVVTEDVDDVTPGPYLTFSSLQPFTLKAPNGKTWDGTLKYSYDTNTWITWDGSTSLQPPEGYRLYMRGIGNTKITGPGLKWELDGTDIACTGNIESLLDYTVVKRGEHPAMAEYCYHQMFEGCTSLTTAPELPATTLANNCYSWMFKGCTRLTTAPELPATTLAGSCYNSMFEGCTSLTTAPELPATTLAFDCYDDMFKGCTSLTTAPELPATTLTWLCYGGMFNGCTRLTTAPELPATTLDGYCYSSMFYGCTSLTTAPELPATSLAWSCYSSMFNGCRRLTTAPSLPATRLNESCYTYMFAGCTGLTTIPELPATTLDKSCYESMFEGCTSLKLSTTATDSYTIAYRIPFAGEGTSGQDSLTDMFTNTGGTFVGTPEINTTYYLDKSNSIV